MRSVSFWSKFGITKTKGWTLEACGRTATATQSGLLAGNGHRHTKWPVGSRLVRFQPGARDTQSEAVCLQPSSSRQCACIESETGKGCFLCRKLSSLVVGRVGRRKQVGLRGHSTAHVCNCRPTSVEVEWHANCEGWKWEGRKVGWCSAGRSCGVGRQSVRGSSYLSYVLSSLF